ncbi:MAG: Bug family tripartite tricarboxylate transporter substrate binding protein [Burkholderiales bacterium]
MLGTFARVLTTLAMGVFLTPGIQAQEWPTKPIRLVIPSAAGGVADIIFRLVAPAMESRLGQRFILDNRPGAGGNAGTAEVVRATPDGYTLLLAPSANYAVNQYLYKTLGFDPLTSLAPVTLLAEASLMAVVNANVPANNLKELLALARANPGKLNYGSPASGTGTHLGGAMFSLLAGDTLVHIPYKGSAPMTVALLANEVQLAFPSLTAVQPHLKSGKLKALAIAGKERNPELPEVPTSAEAGFPELLVGNWWVIAAPRGTDAAIIARLSNEARTALTDAAVRRRIVELGHVPIGMTPAEASAYIASEAGRYKNIVERAGIKPE